MAYKKTIFSLISITFIILVSGCSSTSNNQSNLDVNAENQVQNTNQDANWANKATLCSIVMQGDANNISTSFKMSDYYTTFIAIDAYKQHISTAIQLSDSIPVSQDLKPCKDEYKDGLIDDYNAVILMKQGIDFLVSGDLKDSNSQLSLFTEKLISANNHYDNSTSLLKVYNSAHPNSQLNIELMHHDVSDKSQTSESNTYVETSTPVETPKTKTLADKEPESDSPHPSEKTSETISETPSSQSSSSESIFNYCTWSVELTKKIGEYNKAPANKSYVVVTFKINNTGDQTYSTNPNYWHLKIGDMYYQYDSATYDASMNQLTTDIAPGGKITTKIAYLIDGEPSVSDMNMYYDGPGSDGTIHS